MMTMMTELTAEIVRAESLLIEGDVDDARELLAHLAEDIEEYIDRNCPTTEAVQWFAFPTLFERLAYRRVEEDPRELRDIGEPLDRLYADLALAYVQESDYDNAIEALKRSVRWNPMGCEHRLNLADLFRLTGNMQEYLALTYSVFERASTVTHLERAFANFAAWFISETKYAAAAAALRVARRLDARSGLLDTILSQVSKTDADPDTLSDAEARAILSAEGLPDGANAEIAICLLMCASDAAAAGERSVATDLTVRARDLVGEDAAMALVALIRESDSDA